MMAYTGERFSLLLYAGYGGRRTRPRSGRITMMLPYDIHADPIIQAFITEATADPDVIGLLLSGSRGAGAVHAESDYDLCFVVTDEALARYGPEEKWPVRGAAANLPVKADIWHESPGTLTVAHQPDWELPSYAEAYILLDKTGETTATLTALIHMTEEQAHAAAAAAYDDYLNNLYRSLKAWRRGNELGARLQAAESSYALLRLLFALEQRYRPYHDRLWLHLDKLAGQGWQPDELPTLLLDLLTNGTPRRQQNIARQVAALLQERGFGYVYDGWEGQIDEILAWSFAV